MSHLPLLVSLPDDPKSVELLAEQLSWSKQNLALAKRLRRRRLPPLVDTSCLPYLFGVSAKLISAMGLFPDRYYRVFQRPKKGGGVRQIEAPRQFLKVVQWWINDHILSHQELRPEVTGFVKGKSIFDNGEPHAARKNLMVVDIEDFFPTVAMDRVIEVYVGLGFPEGATHQLARLCCLDGRLPQGAPTSPSIANLVFAPTDEELMRLAQKWGCQYTRYADDLAFSGSRRFTKKDMSQVRKILKRHGFSANESKSRIVGAGARQVVTGLVVNVNPQPPRWKRRLWRAMFHRASKHPHEFFNRIDVLTGVTAFIHQFNSDLAEEYRAVADQVRARAATA